MVNQPALILTATEYKLLELFIKHPRQIVTKDFLYETVRGKNYYVDDNSLKVHISNLRKKIEEYGKEPPYIHTIRGIGYRLNNRTV